MRRALRKLNRRLANHYRLEHIRDHQDRTKRVKSLSQGGQLNEECNNMAKGAVTDSVQPRMGPTKQTLPLEKTCVFVAGEKQTSDPKEAIKQAVGMKK